MGWDIGDKFFHGSTSEALAQVAPEELCRACTCSRLGWTVFVSSAAVVPDSPGIPALLPGFPSPGPLRAPAGSAAARWRRVPGGGSRPGGDAPLSQPATTVAPPLRPEGAAPAPSAGGGLNGAFKLLLTPLSRLPKISINKPLELNGSKTKSSFKCIYPLSFLSFKC